MGFTEKLLQFVTNHWLLVAGFFAALLLLFYEESRAKGAGSAAVTVHEAVNLINHEDALVLDIRDAATYQEGHIIHSKNITAQDLDSKLSKLNAFKTKPVIVICNRGQSAIAVTKKLREAGFERAVTMSGGMQAWKSASMPTTKKGSN